MDMADLTEEKNGKLPSELQCIAALLAPHTRDRMVSTIVGRPGGEELLNPSKRQAVPSADGAVPVTVPERVRRLVELELKSWRADAHEDNFVKTPLLHRKKKSKFKLLGWWLKRKNLYAILMVVAISYHIHVSLASAARPERTFSWCGTINTAKRNRLKPRKLARYVFLKRNKKFWPTKKQVVDEYLRRRAAGEWDDMGFERVSRDLYRLCAQ
jgi:hypothetical protein